MLGTQFIAGVNPERGTPLRGKLIEAYIKALEATDFAERLDKLERMMRSGSPRES